MQREVSASRIPFIHARKGVFAVEKVKSIHVKVIVIFISDLHTTSNPAWMTELFNLVIIPNYL